MKEIFKNLGIFFWDVLKRLDWKSVLYKTLKGTVLPLIQKKVDDTTSKIDDVIYNGLAQLVEKFLAPEVPAGTVALNGSNILPNPSDEGLGRGEVKEGLA